MEGAMRMSDQSPVAGERVADALHLDGNVAAGMLSEMFVPDLTAARTTCAHCGATRMMGALLAYAHGMGIVVRCPNCDHVVMRIARTPAQLWLDMTGASRIVIPATTPSA